MRRPSPWRPSAFLAKVVRGAISSVGRAPRLHRGCRRFESVIAHHPASRDALRRICAVISREAGCPPKPWRRRAAEMRYVCLLESEAIAGQRYVGATVDLKQRLAEHNAGKSPHTSKYAPWRLVTYVAFSDQRKAEAFERYLKSGSGHAFARKRLW